MATLFQIRRKNIPSANTDELWKCCYECFRELDEIMAEEYTYAYEKAGDGATSETGNTTDAGTVENEAQKAVKNGETGSSGTNADKKTQNDTPNNTESGSKVNSSLNSAAGFKTKLNEIKDWITKALDEMVSKALTLANRIVEDSDPKFFDKLEEAKKKGKKNEIKVQNYKYNLDFLKRVTAIIKEAQNKYQNFEPLVNNFKNTAGTEGSNDGTADDESFKKAAAEFTYEKLHEGLLKGFGVIENQQKAEAGSSKGGSSIPNILIEKCRGPKKTDVVLNEGYANTCENYLRNSAKANFDTYRDAFNTIKSMRDKNNSVLDTLQQSNSTDNEANGNMISALNGMSKFLLEITTLCTAGLKLLLEIHVNCKIVLQRYYGFTYKSDKSRVKAKQPETTGDNNAKS